MGTMRLTLDAPDRESPAEVSLDQLGALLGDARNRLWLDLCDPDQEDVALLRRLFGFHDLALEEVTKSHDRPRCDTYGRYYFIVVYAAEQTGEGFAPRELNIFWGENYLVTIHRGPAAVVNALRDARRRWERHDRRQSYGLAALAYMLFEAVVESYFTVQDRVRERMEGIEEAIFRGREQAAADLFRLRKELLRVPRLLAPTVHVLAEILRREQSIPEALRPYFGDVQDHATHVLAELDTYRDLLGAALDTQTFYSFARLGNIMKRLTAITVIILVPNFVASIYGMNFERLVPPAAWDYGFIAVAAFLAIMVIWGFIHSRMLGWL